MIYIRCRPLAPVDWATAGLGYRWFADQKFVDDFQYYYYYYGPAGLDPDYGSFFFFARIDTHARIFVLPASACRLQK